MRIKISKEPKFVENFYKRVKRDITELIEIRHIMEFITGNLTITITNLTNSIVFKNKTWIEAEKHGKFPEKYQDDSPGIYLLSL